MKVKILKIEEKELYDGYNNIHVICSNNTVLKEVNENDSAPKEFYCEEKIYYKKYYVMDNKQLEIFPSCEITNFLLQLHEDMNMEVNGLYKKNTDLYKQNTDLRNIINKLKKSFWKRLVFLFKGEY